jgi:DNA gyrase/topoisomerase IV subunit A
MRNASSTVIFNKELILLSMADLERSIPSMVDGFKSGQRKILFCSFKRNLVKDAKVCHLKRVPKFVYLR